MNELQSALVRQKAECSGCGGCSSICPVKAISMARDELGAVYPVIDEKQCVRCGKCLDLCGAIRSLERNPPLRAYASAGRDEQLVSASASGGVFASVAMAWIQQGGAVAGAVMDCSEDAVRVYHILSDRAEDIRRMQGSKYVHSEAWRCYDEVRQALRRGAKVLFTGTPCQAAAIKALTGNPDNLVTMDLVCHGVPPLAMLDEYAGILSKRLMGKLDEIQFRDKTSGKSFRARISIQYRHKKKDWLLSSQEMSYYRYFLEGAIYRENCYSCPYADGKRVSDITIGDYWGIQEKHGDEIENSPLGNCASWSCVLICSEKGRAAFERYGGALHALESKAEWIAEQNAQLKHPSAKPENRQKLLERYKAGGYRAIEEEFIRGRGGKLRFTIRMIKRMYRSRKGCSADKG